MEEFCRKVDQDKIAREQNKDEKDFWYRKEDVNIYMRMFKQVKLLPAEAQLAHISLNKLSALQDLIPCQDNRVRYGKSPCRLNYIKNELHLSASPCTRSLILPKVHPLLESLKVK